MLKLATPEPFNERVPRMVEPSLKVTEPEGVPDPGKLASTVAVNVTRCPKTDGPANETTIELAASLLTVCAIMDDVLPVKSASPP